MRKHLVGALTTTALVFAASAHAADLPVRTAPALAAPVFAPIFTWTGFYVGVNAGAASDSSRLTITPDPATFGTPALPLPAFSAEEFAFLAAEAREDEIGAVGGGQVGYNHQIGPFVVGLEADFAFADLRNRRDDTMAFADAFGGGLVGVLNAARNQQLTYNTSLQTRVEWFGTVRGRLGIAIDRGLIYATGGFAYGQIETSVASFTTPADFFAPFIDENRGRTSGIRGGWTAGGGFEYALTDSVALKGEYLYVDLGRKRSSAPAIGGNLALFPGSTFSVQEETRFHSIRAGLNFRFGT